MVDRCEDGGRLGVFETNAASVPWRLRARSMARSCGVMLRSSEIRTSEWEYEMTVNRYAKVSTW